MKPQKIFPFLLAVGLFLLVLGLLLLFRYAQARGSMMVLAFVFVGAFPKSSRTPKQISLGVWLNFDKIMIK